MENWFKYGSVLLIFMLLSYSGKCQIAGNTNQKIEVNQDPRIDQLVAKHILINQQVRGTEGFRIQIFSDSGTNSKSKAQSVLDEFLSKFSEVGAYLSFKSPNYRVRVGDFRTRLDAQRFLIEISSDYQNAFIISDMINVP